MLLTKTLEIKWGYRIKNHYINKGYDFTNINDKFEIKVEDLATADVIMLSSEPFPFKENHILELKEFYPDKKIMIVDGEAFSWYGTHIAKCEDYFKELVSKFN